MSFNRPLLPRPFQARKWVRFLHSSSPLNDGLKILFCGSDKFSLKALEAITDLKRFKEGCIESIDVLTKIEAPMGRGLKIQRRNPVEEFSYAQGLTNHKVDTLKDWNLPVSIDLIIAVSFGLFIPARLLSAATYGGWNIHPSFLPKYRGSAPIQHALFNGDKTTGVVLQTLDLHKFDHGKILCKSDPVAIDIDKTVFPELAYQGGSPYSFLESTLATEGAKLLTTAVADKIYAVQSSLPEIDTGETKSMARKIPTERSLIRFGESTAEEIFRLGLVFKRVYCYRHTKDASGAVISRRVLLGPLRLPTQKERQDYLENTQEQWVYIPRDKTSSSTRGIGSGTQDAGSMALRVNKDEWILVKNITVEGKGKRDARWWLDTTNLGKTYFSSEARPSESK